MTRIRYNKSASGMLTSKELLAGSGTVTISLDPVKLSAVIVNSKNEVVSTLTATTLHGLKKAAKAVVLSLGVHIFDEVRRKKVETQILANLGATNGTGSTQESA